MHEAEVEAVRWMSAAAEDPAYARHAAAGGFHAPACFHAQRAAEKAVKAIHYRRGARAVLGHSVRALMESLEPREGALGPLIEAARDLDLFYLPTRYPNGLEAGTPGEAFSAAQSTRAIDLSDGIVEAARALVGP